MYLSNLCNETKCNKYQKIYVNLIERAPKEHPNDGYYEKHHILPKFFKLGGEKDKLNMCFLTPREHFIAHLVLTKIVKTKTLLEKASCAVAYFSNTKNGRRQFKSHELNEIRKANSVASKARNKGNQHWKNRQPDSTEHRLKKSNRASSSRWVTNEVEELFTVSHEAYISRGFRYGRKEFTEEIKIKKKEASIIAGRRRKGIKITNTKKMSEAAKKRDISTRASSLNAMHKKHPCPHCGKVTTVGNLKRWHFENCKLYSATLN